MLFPVGNADLCGAEAARAAVSDLHRQLAPRTPYGVRPAVESGLAPVSIEVVSSVSLGGRLRQAASNSVRASPKLLAVPSARTPRCEAG